MTGRLWECTQLGARIPSDSVEFFPIEVRMEGVVVKHGLTVSVSKVGASRNWRPIDVDATGRTGVTVRKLSAGTYQVAVRSGSGAVMEAGIIRSR